ncbi:MAG: sulfatase [Isosphaeraceae bacterium]
MNRLSRLVLAALGLVVGSSATRAADPTPVPPNVVLIISDDHGWTDYGFMGHPQVVSPNLDRLASQSQVYRRGYVTSSLCCPSLATLITGRYPHEHKVTSNDPPIPPGMRPAEFHRSEAFLQGRETMNKHLEALPTLPRLLSKKGYVSFQSGKWWQGDYSRGGFTDGMTRGQRHGDAGLEIGRQTLEPIDQFMTRAKMANTPFFVWYAPMMPHTPHNPPEKYLAKAREKTPSIHLARYWAMIEWFDDSVGQLLSSLDRLGLTENTMVIYVADNGWTQDPARGDSIRSKRSPYDAGLRTPIMVRWPGRVTPGVSDVPVLSIDVAPTILAAAGVSRPEGMTGLDLTDLKAVAARPSVQGACFTHNAVDLDDPDQNLLWRWMVKDRWKLILPKAGPDAPPAELYDVVADPAETRDLRADHPEIVRDLSARLDQWWRPAH